MISKEEVEHIAKLARLELTQEEIEKMQKDLSGVFDYFELLKTAPTLKKQVFNETGKGNALREDKVASSYNTRDKIIIAAPDKKEGYIKVKGIL